MIATTPAVPTVIIDNIDVVELLENQLYMQSLELIALGVIAGAIITIPFVRWWKNG